MGSPLPPDPYLALGVPKDATTAAVKTAHRKLVLKCHPDKVTDPTAKEEASDKFHKIQTAYEILVDEERRARYDAQVRLAGLRKEAMERQGGSGSRAAESRSAPSPYKTSYEPAPRPGLYTRSSERVTPQYEERKPSYAADYDAPPRATAQRKDPEYERSSKRTAPEPKEKPRGFFTRSKESEKERSKREKSKKAEKDNRRDRDRKQAAYADDESEGSSTVEYARWQKQIDEERRAKEAQYSKSRQPQQQEADDYFDDPRTRKMFSATTDARDYIQSRSRHYSDSEQRPSPVRRGSSRDDLDHVRRNEGRPTYLTRKGSERPSERPERSERPKATSRESESTKKSSSRKAERRTSADDEAKDERRAPPPLNHARSSPADIRLPADKQRSYSLQPDSDDVPPMPGMRRAETMPYSGGRRNEQAGHPRAAEHRQTEFTGGLATPAATPGATHGVENVAPSAAAAKSSKYRYGRQYADDDEYPTPDGYRSNDRSDPYRTEVRQPNSSSTTRPTLGRKVTRSPSPVKDTRDLRDAREPRDARDSRDRPERPRMTSSKFPSGSQPARSTSYVYTPGQGVEQYSRSRQTSARESNARDPGYSDLYGEIQSEGRPGAGSPRQKEGPFTPTDESYRYAPRMRQEDIKYRTGYGSRQTGHEKATMSRQNSGMHPIRA